MHKLETCDKQVASRMVCMEFNLEEAILYGTERKIERYSSESGKKKSFY